MNSKENTNKISRQLDDKQIKEYNQISDLFREIYRVNWNEKSRKEIKELKKHLFSNRLIYLVNFAMYWPSQKHCEEMQRNIKQIISPNFGPIMNQNIKIEEIKNIVEEYCQKFCPEEDFKSYDDLMKSLKSKFEVISKSVNDDLEKWNKELNENQKKEYQNNENVELLKSKMISEKIYFEYYKEIFKVFNPYLNLNNEEFALVNLKLLDFFKRKPSKDDKQSKADNAKQSMDNNSNIEECFVCNNGETSKCQIMYKCKSCKMCLHKGCYKIEKDEENESDFTCELCRLKDQQNNQPKKCILCPVSGGAMKQIYICGDRFKEDIESSEMTRKNNDVITQSIFVPKKAFFENKNNLSWVHCSCLWFKNSYEHDENKTKWADIVFIENNNYHKCSICKETKGPTYKCYEQKCQKYYHPECARKYGVFLKMNLEDNDFRIYCEGHEPSKAFYIENDYENYISNLQSNVTEFKKFLLKFIDLKKWNSKEIKFIENFSSTPLITEEDKKQKRQREFNRIENHQLVKEILNKFPERVTPSYQDIISNEKLLREVDFGKYDFSAKKDLFMNLFKDDSTYFDDFMKFHKEKMNNL